jgi:hypothetical protein
VKLCILEQSWFIGRIDITIITVFCRARLGLHRASYRALISPLARNAPAGFLFLGRL